MRPVERGAAPREYARYGDAIGDLEERLGKYCSYCERRLPIGLAVEHMAPKNAHRDHRDRDRELDWDNFLLGCTNCNSVKGNTEVADADVLWPDRHNTMLAFAYSRGGLVRVAGGLTPDLQRRARALMELVGLDRHSQGEGGQPAKRDRRWMDREEAWATAELFRSRFEELGRSDEVRSSVVDAARYCGLFSVWFAVFDRHVDVRLELINAFPGTAASCFGQHGRLVNRPGAET